MARPNYMDLVEYMYKAAFIHGWKHAEEATRSVGTVCENDQDTVQHVWDALKKNPLAPDELKDETLSMAEIMELIFGDKKKDKETSILDVLNEENFSKELIDMIVVFGDEDED